MTKPRIKPKQKIDLVEHRKSLLMTQRDYWAALGVQQSAGSRYEAGRDIPLAVRMLAGYVYGVTYR